MKEILIQVTLLNTDIDNDVVHDSELSNPSFIALASSTPNSMIDNFHVTRYDICRVSETGRESEKM